MKKMYVSSQFFGFGPTSNLFSILKNLKMKSDSFEIYALKNEVMELFSERSPGVIDQWSNEINYSNLDILLSSFDPFTVVDAWLKDIPSVFYCNLFWYWDVFQKRDRMIEHRDNLYQLKKSNHFAEAKNLFMDIFNNNPHEGIFLGYMLSTHCFTRNFFGLDQLFDIYKNEMNMSFCDIFIPYQLTKNANFQKNQVLIQLSGSRNSVVTTAENTCYLQLCIQLAKYIGYLQPNLEIVICANPVILNQATTEKLPDNVRLIPSVSQEENFNMMENALALFTSPGLETIYEAIYCNCPVFLLPEQNAGQFSIFQLLQTTGFDPNRFLINEEFPSRPVQFGEEDAHEIYKIIQQNVLFSELNLNRLCELAFAFIENMQNEKERNSYLAMSLNSLKSKSEKSPFTTNDTVSDFIIHHYT